MGAYGPFIVLPTDYHVISKYLNIILLVMWIFTLQLNSLFQKNQQYADDFYLVVSDYMTKTSPEILLNAKFKATE